MSDSEASITGSGVPMADSPLASRVHPSPNHGERRGVEPPDSIILHYTGMPSASEALLWLANPISEVSCHYFVFEDGRIWQMVPENRRAWHAGKGAWHGESDMNSRSIGIEIANPGHDLTPASASESLSPAKAGMDTGSREADASKERSPGAFPPPGPDFPQTQIEAVIALVADIKARWKIPDARILAHSDIAPGRKVDPGEKFPWAKLAEAGLGLWAREDGQEKWSPVFRPPIRADEKQSGPVYRPGDEGMPVAALQSMFAHFGYDLEITGVYDQKTQDVVAAFQRHWRQEKVDGVADGETLVVLRRLYSAATI